MIINLISGPRNISTALMYSFAQRPGCAVLDEPFYARYLARSAAAHPGREDTLAYQSIHTPEIVAEIFRMAADREALFVKNMAHHLSVEDMEFLTECQNVFLIREPAKMIASFAEVIPNPSMQDIGLAQQTALYDMLADKTDRMPPVLDSAEVLKAPREVLTALCAQLGLDFDRAMLSWPAGEVHEAVPWAKYWYGGVLKSKGFRTPRTTDRPLPVRCKPLYEAALPHYNKLKEHSIKAPQP